MERRRPGEREEQGGGDEHESAASALQDCPLGQDNGARRQCALRDL
jgi:hypothetical protein